MNEAAEPEEEEKGCGKEGAGQRVE